jgi:hypothetical protein
MHIDAGAGNVDAIKSLNEKLQSAFIRGARSIFGLLGTKALNELPGISHWAFATGDCYRTRSKRTPRRLADAIVNFPRVLRLLDIHLRTFAGQAAASWK